MHLLSALVTLLGVASARSFLFQGGNQAALESKLRVPGKNPLYFCQETTQGYSLTIEKVDLTPNPPKPGSKLVIEASGTFTEEILQGAYINLSVKYGLITLIKTKADLCDQLKEVDEGCPISGDKIIRKEVNIPKEVPPGTYHVLADVYTKDEERVTCLDASIHFG